MTSVSCAKCGLVSWAEEGAACKRCGASAAEMKAAQKRPSRAPRRADADSGGKARPCCHCGRTIHLSRWDDWNGFLVECQHCGGMHGKHWRIRYVMLASFVFNAVSFLFTMRPAAAVPLLSAFVAAGVAGSFFIGRVNPTLEIVAVVAFIHGPMLINAVVLLNHHGRIDGSAPTESPVEA
jgi:hypothetical protein